MRHTSSAGCTTARLGGDDRSDLSRDRCGTSSANTAGPITAVCLPRPPHARHRLRREAAQLVGALLLFQVAGHGLAHGASLRGTVRHPDTVEVRGWNEHT